MSLFFGVRFIFEFDVGEKALKKILLVREKGLLSPLARVCHFFSPGRRVSV